MLVVWYRRKHTDEQPEIPRSFRRRRGTPQTPLIVHMAVSLL